MISTLTSLVFCPFQTWLLITTSRDVAKNFVSDKIICMLIMRIMKLKICTVHRVYTIRTVRCVYTLCYKCYIQNTYIITNPSVVGCHLCCVVPHYSIRWSVKITKCPLILLYFITYSHLLTYICQT